SWDTIRNRAVTDAFEPGSVNKIVTAAAALQEGFMKLDQRLRVPDYYKLYTKVFRDAHVHPVQQMTLGDILAYSSNVGTIDVAQETTRALIRMLAYAVDVGTGTQAQIPGYWVAGKTGTARKVKPDGTGYEEGKYVASFIGFAPAAHPAVVVAAVLDEPATVYGGVAAAPLFREVARFALARLRVSPAHRLPWPPHAIRIPS